MFKFNKQTTLNNNDDDGLPPMERLSLGSTNTVTTAATAATDASELSDYAEFNDIYQLGKILGEGGYGKVHQCFLKGSSGNPRRDSFAVKTVDLENYDHDEIDILDELSECPNITRVIDLFHSDENAYIVMDEMKGGDLLDRINDKDGCYEEKEAKVLFRTLLETLQFCHSRGIVHCDLKPENILLMHEDNDIDMQLADFGMAQRFKDSNNRRLALFDPAGTVEYMCPEMLMQIDVEDEGYDERCDIWSAGLILYILLGGYHPFDADDMDDLVEQICTGSWEFHRKYWKSISKEAKELITKMLKVDPAERCSLEDALDSDWFKTSN